MGAFIHKYSDVIIGVVATIALVSMTGWMGNHVSASMGTQISSMDTTAKTTISMPQ